MPVTTEVHCHRPRPRACTSWLRSRWAAKVMAATSARASPSSGLLPASPPTSPKATSAPPATATAMPSPVAAEGRSPRNQRARATQMGTVVTRVTLAAMEVKASDGSQVAKWTPRSRPATTVRRRVPGRQRAGPPGPAGPAGAGEGGGHPHADHGQEQAGAQGAGPDRLVGGPGEQGAGRHRDHAGADHQGQDRGRGPPHLHRRPSGGGSAGTAVGGPGASRVLRCRIVRRSPPHRADGTGRSPRGPVRFPPADPDGDRPPARPQRTCTIGAARRGAGVRPIGPPC